MPQNSKSKVRFFYEVDPNLKSRFRLRKFIEHIFKTEGVELDSLNYIFCSDKQLLSINQQFLNHDYYTDIISFELSDKNSLLQGEIYISVERVKQNSKALKEPFSREILRVIIHGVLHFCGYKDKTKKDVLMMRKKENDYIRKYELISRDTVSR